MEADAAGEQPVDVRAGVIKSTSGDPGQTHGESANRRLVADLTVRAGQSVASIDPHARTGIDQDIGDQRIGQQGLEGAGSQDLGRQVQPRSKSTSLPQDHRLTLEYSRNEPRCRDPAQTDLRPDRG